MNMNNGCVYADGISDFTRRPKGTPCEVEGRFRRTQFLTHNLSHNRLPKQKNICKISNILTACLCASFILDTTTENLSD